MPTFSLPCPAAARLLASLTLLVSGAALGGTLPPPASAGLLAHAEHEHAEHAGAGKASGGGVSVTVRPQSGHEHAHEAGPEQSSVPAPGVEGDSAGHRHSPGAGHDMPHASQVQPSPLGERLLLDAYSEGSLPARVLALHEALGARLDAHDEAGQTLLMKAAARDDFPLVQALLAAEVAIDVTDIHGWSALEHAVQGNATDAALALMDAGAVERVDHHENSTLQYAVNLVGDTRVVAALVAAGADVNRRSLDGLTVLMEAIDAGNPLATIRTLLEAADIDLAALNPHGQDALAHARERRDAAITEAVTAAVGR